LLPVDPACRLVGEGSLDVVDLAGLSFAADEVDVGRLGLVAERPDAADRGLEPHQSLEVLVARDAQRLPVAASATSTIERATEGCWCPSTA
jgi:hypothetical protein